ncbi:MAG: hypothetical protein Q9159_004129 [Coniocarpon cinnabarinum]
MVCIVRPVRRQPQQASGSSSSHSATATASSTPGTGGNETSGTSAGDGSLGIPSGLLTSKAGIPFGFLPDSATKERMSDINKALGSKSAGYGWYSQITSTTYDDSQLTEIQDDLVASGAVFIPAVMPTKVKFNQINDDLAQQIAKSMQTFTDQGVEVWLRFAHEMNYYVTDGTYAGGSPEEFIEAWKNVHTAVQSNSKVKMFWSPNEASSSDLQAWFPGADVVDIVGMDDYPKAAAATFADTFGDFYNAFAKKYSIPFVIGETGTGSGDVTAKEHWLKELTNADYTDFPLYKMGNWFEYNKEFDFHVVLDVDQDTLGQTKSNFQ